MLAVLGAHGYVRITIKVDHELIFVAHKPCGGSQHPFEEE